MVEQDPKDRRKSPRIRYRTEVRIQAIKASGETVQIDDAQVENVSAGGVFVSASQPVDPGMLTDFTMTMGEGRDEINLLGLVRWKKEGKGLGLEFFFSSDEERELVMSRLSELARGNPAD